MTNTNWSEAWKEFRKSHYEVFSYVKANGSYKRIACVCGWTNDLRGNAGIALGYKIAWQNHFYSIYPEFISNDRAIREDEVVELVKCEKCGSPSECTVEKSWHSANGRVESYCLEHGKEFERLPGFKVTYIKKGDSPETGSLAQDISPSRVGEIASYSTQPEVTTIEKKSAGKKYVKWATYLTVILAAGGLLTWNDNVQSRNSALEALQLRNEFAKSCFTLKEEDQAARSGPVGSEARIKAVTIFYEKVIESPCVVWGDGTIFKNEFYGVNSKSIIWSSLESAFVYSLQRWNSVEDLNLRCADGWESPSIGKQGACSSHGGVVSGFNQSKNSDLAHFLSSGQRIYPALYILEDAAN